MTSLFFRHASSPKTETAKIKVDEYPLVLGKLKSGRDNSIQPAKQFPNTLSKGCLIGRIDCNDAHASPVEARTTRGILLTAHSFVYWVETLVTSRVLNALADLQSWRGDAIQEANLRRKQHFSRAF